MKTFELLDSIKYGYWINPFLKPGGIRINPIDFKGMGIKTEVPRTYVNNRLIITAMWLDYDYLTTEYCNFMTIGGIISFDLLEYPQVLRNEGGK
jgi:hypothetical protein